MREPDLDGINLNALRILDVLLATGNVRQAAARLGVTPSAVSHVLRQLRDDLGDDLLVRVGHRMVPTPRAEAMAGPLRRALLEIEAAVRVPPAFDPATADRRFVLAASDVVVSSLLPPLVRRLGAEAPRIGLDLVPLDLSSVAAALEDGALDAAIAPALRAAAGLRSRALGPTGFAVLAWDAHPELGEVLDLDTYCRLPHAVVSVGGSDRGPVSAALDRLGRSRWVALRVHSFLAAPAAIVGTRLLLTCPGALAEQLAERYPLRRFAPPLALPIGSVSLVWHERLDREPGLRWLRGAIAEVVRAG